MESVLIRRYVLLLFLFAFTFSSNAFEYSANDIQRVRLNFTGPQGYIRPLLLGFTPDDAATDGYDPGYDGAASGYAPDDLNWLIEDQRYVIQGVGSFNAEKAYPLGMYLGHSGTIKIALHQLENFDENIDVYIYDTLYASHHQINEQDLELNLNSGDYENRFYITFSSTFVPEPLSVNEEQITESKVFYESETNTLSISAGLNSTIQSYRLYSLTGKLLFEKQGMVNREVKHNLATKETFAILRITTDKGLEVLKIAMP